MSKPLQIISVRDIAKTASTCSSISAISTSFVDCSSLTHSVVTTVEEISIRQGESFSRADKSIAKNNTSFAVPKVFVKDLNIDYSSVLGSGTFGTVCKGNWAGSEVAIKAISINKRSHKAMLRMVVKEIEISSKLRHPNIIQFLAIARGETTIYLVHEYINECNMEDAIFCAEKKLEMGITQQDKLFIMRQVVQSLPYMHALVPIVLHNDIKPGNVMIKKVVYAQSYVTWILVEYNWLVQLQQLQLALHVDRRVTLHQNVYYGSQNLPQPQLFGHWV
jgi:hypothetical protein